MSDEITPMGEPTAASGDPTSPGGDPTPPRTPWWVIGLAVIGGILLVVVAFYRWGTPADEHAYWLAADRLLHGQPLYDPAATLITPYAYLYPPPLAQVLVPVAAIVPSWLFDAAWTVAMGLALWWLAGRDILRTLALVAFPPVAAEFWFRNINLFLAVMVVLGLRRWAGWFAIGAAIKVSPGLGIPYIALRGRWRDAAIATGVGIAILVVSIVLSPSDWQAYISFLVDRGPTENASFLPVPFLVRALIAAGIVVVASRLDQRRGDVLCVVAITLALPSLWFAGLSVLVAVVPLSRATLPSLAPSWRHA
jgi:hypothetical protein